MSVQGNTEGSSDGNKCIASYNEPTSIETATTVEEDTDTQFDFVEETLQITDVHDIFDVTTSVDDNVNSTNESASCFDQLCSAGSDADNQLMIRTHNEIDYLNCSRESQIQFNQLHSVDLNSFTRNSSNVLETDLETAETDVCDKMSNTFEFNDPVCQDINNFLNKSVEQQYVNVCKNGSNKPICSEIDKNCSISSQNFDAQSSQNEEILHHLSMPGSKFDEIIKDHNTIEYDGNENTASVCNEVLTTQNENEGCHYEGATNIELNKRSFVENTAEKIDTESGTSNFLEKKINSDSNEATEIEDSGNKARKINSFCESIDLQLVNMSFDQYSTSTDESSSDVFEDAVDSSIQKDLTKTAVYESGYYYGEQSLSQNGLSDLKQDTSNSIESLPEFLEDTISSHTNLSNVYTSDSSFLSNPSGRDSFEGSYLVQEPLVILEAEDSNSSHTEAESFALTDVQFMQFSTSEIFKDAVERVVEIDQAKGLEDCENVVDPLLLEQSSTSISHDENVLSNTLTDLGSGAALISDTSNNISGNPISQDGHNMSLQTPAVFDIEHQSKLCEINVSLINTSMALDNKVQVCEKAKQPTSGELYEEILKLDGKIHQEEQQEMANDVTLELQASQDKSTGEDKSQPVSFEIIKVQELGMDLNKPLVEPESDFFTKESIVATENATKVNLSSEINSKTSLFQKESTQRDMSLTLLDDRVEQYIDVHEYDSNKSCSADDGFTNILDTNKTNLTLEQNESCLSSEKSSLNVADFINNTTTNETNDFSSDADQKLSDAVYIVSSFDSNENSNQSLNDHGLQSFMELTVANVDPAMYEQSMLINHTRKPSTLSSLFKEYQGDDKESNKSLKVCQADTEIKTSNNEDLDSSFQSEYGNSVVNISHEIMQHTMCDYVTNQVLQLTIPDSDNIGETNYSNENTHKQCERQTENVLLMKWPPKFHEQIKTLQEQNLFLSEQVKLGQSKAEHITSIEVENKKLADKLEGQLKQIIEDKLIITDLQNQNKQLTCDLDCLKAIENNLDDFKINNKKLKEDIEIITKEKACELKALTDKIEELQQNLISVGETVEALQSKNEALLKLSNDINAKDEHIKTLVEDKSVLTNNIKSLNERLEELHDLERANQMLTTTIEQEVQKTAEAEKLIFSLQEQVTNLTSQNELLWKELQVSTTKEQALYVVNEEKRILEDRIVLLKKELDELDKLKQGSKQLIEKLTARDYDICSLTDDKEKLMNSLLKANDKLNALESENEYLTEVTKELKFKIGELNSQVLSLEETKSTIESEKLSLQNTLNDVSKNEREHNSAIEFERIAMQDSMTSIGEYIMSLVLEKEWLNEQVQDNKNQMLVMEKENQLLKNRISSGKTSLDCIQSENINLLNQLTYLQNQVDSLTEELNIKETQCLNIVNVQMENEQLSLKIKSLIEDVACFESEKESAMKELGSLSEAVGSVFMDREVLYGHLTEASKNIEQLENKKKQLKQQVSDMESTINEFQQSKLSLLSQLQNASEKDAVIEAHKGMIRELEIHISSLNEELFSEISKQNLLEIDSIRLKSRIDELESQNGLLQRQNAVALEKDQVIYDMRINQQSLKNRIEALSEKSKNLQDENNSMKDELQKGKETTNNLLNSKLNLSIILESKNNEINTLVQKVENLEQKVCELQLSTSSLKTELDNSKEKDVEIHELKGLVKEMEQHVSSLNEELFSEISKHDFVYFTKETLESQNKEIEKEIATLKSMSESIHNLKCENSQLKTELQDTILKFRNENQQLLQSLRDVDITLKAVIDEKVELESKLSEKMKLLRESESSKNSDQECHVKDNVQLREVMLKEINSLSGSTQFSSFESLSLVEVYQKLMAEFLSKEREVISSLQNDYEDKKITMKIEVTSLQNVLEDKESLSLKLEQEINELKQQLSEHKVTSSELSIGLQEITEELKNKEKEITEIKTVLRQTEQDNKRLIAEIKCLQHSETESKLEEEVLFLNNEVQCKNIEMVDLRNEIEKLKVKEVEFTKRLEGEKEIVHQHQEDVNRLNQELNNKEELISKLELQLLNKSNEVEQLNTYLESKKKEKEDYEKKVEELSSAAVELSQIKEDINVIENYLRSMNGEPDIAKLLLEAVQSCEVLDCIMKTILDQWTKCENKIQLSNATLESQLLKRVDECKTLNTQINCLNEELKAHRLLYDEDILQLKEEVVSKDQTISMLSDKNTQLELDHAKMLEKIKSFENEDLKIDQLKIEIEKLKEENLRLAGDYSKFNVFKEVNRKLSLEIEELSRSIKFEKQSNNDLKAKYDMVSNQLAASKKKNFSLEDKIEILENKLQNQNLMESIKIAFPVSADSIDKRVIFINEKLVEYEQQKEQLQHLLEEYSVLKHEHEKSSEYIKKQEEKMSKILKRELDLKKQIASINQTNTNEGKILEKVKAELFSFFPEKPTSFPEAFVKVRNLLEESKSYKSMNPVDTEELKKMLEEAQQENKDLDNECEMMNKHIKEQEEQLISVLKREEELKKEIKDLKAAKLDSQIQPFNETSEDSVKELFLAFPEKPTSIKGVLDLIKTTLAKNEALTEKITESQEECASMDKECEEMFKAYQLKESELVDVLKREAKTVTEFKAEAVELQNTIHSLREELERSKSEKLLLPQAKCQCDELQSRLKDLKVDLADRNAKITVLELQFEADNFPIKKKASELEKSLDQAKQKISELKAEVRRYQEQMHEVTVGLRADCESCRRNNATRSELSVQTSPSTVDYAEQLTQKTKEISILKALCKSRNQRIAELEQGSGKVPRPHRSALKPGKENANVTLSPTKSTKGNNAF